MQALALALLAAPLSQDPQVLDARIDSVTVYPNSAHVHRSSELLSADGSYVISGLTNDLDRSRVRVKCASAEIVRVEVLERLEKEVSDEEIAALVEELKAAKRELEAANDRGRLNEAMRAHLTELFNREQEASAKSLSEGTAPVEAWDASFEFLSRRMDQLLTEKRELGWALQEQGEVIKRLEHEIGDARSGALRPVVDVLVETAGISGAGAKIEVEYVVNRAGWSPVYDLRAASDAQSVRLVYRAEVYQRTLEDWDNVELLLSTAQPHLGAQGPDPQSSWVDVIEPASKGRFGRRADAPSSIAGIDTAVVEYDAEVMEEGAASLAWTHAAVESEGLSLRYRIARSETVESRSEPTVVLVGQADLEADPEYYCAPALDTTVWLRGVATNTSPWTLLPGRAAVFFGADYLGDASLGMVQAEQEFTLHLGAAPMISIERTQFEDIEEEPGFLSSVMSKRRSWRVHFENHGSTVVNADGSVTVLVRESVPISQDSRLEVLVPRSEPARLEGERWDQEREEEGIHTWELNVPANGEADLVYSVELRYPKELRVTGW